MDLIKIGAFFHIEDERHNSITPVQNFGLSYQLGNRVSTASFK